MHFIVQTTGMKHTETLKGVTNLQFTHLLIGKESSSRIFRYSSCQNPEERRGVAFSHYTAFIAISFTSSWTTECFCCLSGHKEASGLPSLGGGCNCSLRGRPAGTTQGGKTLQTPLRVIWLKRK